MTFEPEHDFPQFRLRSIGGYDFFCGLFADALHCFQQFGLLLNHIQGVRTELSHQTFGHGRANAINDTGSQEAFNALHTSRRFQTDAYSLKLLAKAGMRNPGAGKMHLLSN